MRSSRAKVSRRAGGAAPSTEGSNCWSTCPPCLMVRRVPRERGAERGHRSRCAHTRPLRSSLEIVTSNPLMWEPTSRGFPGRTALVPPGYASCRPPRSFSSAAAITAPRWPTSPSERGVAVHHSGRCHHGGWPAFSVRSQPWVVRIAATARPTPVERTYRAATQPTGCPRARRIERGDSRACSGLGW